MMIMKMIMVTVYGLDDHDGGESNKTFHSFKFILQNTHQSGFCLINNFILCLTFFMRCVICHTKMIVNNFHPVG